MSDAVKVGDRFEWPATTRGWDCRQEGVWVAVRLIEAGPIPYWKMRREADAREQGWYPLERPFRRLPGEEAPVAARLLPETAPEAVRIREQVREDLRQRDVPLCPKTCNPATPCKRDGCIAVGHLALESHIATMQVEADRAAWLRAR